MGRKFILLVGLENIDKSGILSTNSDNISYETRYYISSQEGFSAFYYNALVRGHWGGIENQLHWLLENSCREEYTLDNLFVLRKLVLQIIKNQKNKLSIKKRRLKAAHNLNYLKDIIHNFSCV